MDKCSTVGFNTTDKDTYDWESIGDHLCLEGNYNITGNYIAPVFEYLELKFYKCSNSTENGNSCLPQDEIDSILADSQLGLRVVNRYVDFNDYSNPVKEFIDDQFYWEMVPFMRKKVNLYMRHSYGLFMDDYLQLGSAKNVTFAQVEDQDLQLVSLPGSGQVFSLYIRADKLYQIFDRRIYSIGDLFGQLGGVF